MQRTAKDLISGGLELFGKRGALISLWQELADNFFPQRADFTVNRYIGDEFASNLYSSYPVLVHRELGSSLGGMLRPRSEEWFKLSVEGFEDDEPDTEAKRWLEHQGRRQRAAMYDRRAKFVRATKEGDDDFALTGQCVIQRIINYNADVPHLHYRCWHLRDVAWLESALGEISEIYIRWKPTLQQLGDLKMELHHSFSHKKTASPREEVQCLVLAISTDLYQGMSGQGENYPWMLVYLDIANNHIMKEVGVKSHGITIPRWQTVSGSQYAYSPAAVAGLPDARLLQAMSLTLLEAGEMSVRPPMIATQDALRSDIQLHAGGITWADGEYDERKGDVLRPITQDRRGLPMGYENREHQYEMLNRAFYLNKLGLPPPTPGMTAYEASERVREYIRQALPLFEPMEHDYNGAICDDTFDGLMDAGFFGAPQDMPRSLRGRTLKFQFKSPLSDAMDRRSTGVFSETSELLAQAMQIEPAADANVDVNGVLRDALEGVGVPQKHIRSTEEVEERVAQRQEMAQAQQEAELLATAGKGARDMAAA